MNIVAAYTLLAPVYDLSRPLWAKWVMDRAEFYLEKEVLPGWLTPETRILDLGCGTGINQERLRRLDLPYASYTGLDLTPAMLARAQAKLDGQDPAAYCQGDVRHLPYPDQCFDMVLSTWVLSHLSPPQTVLAEARRVLKREGVLILLLWSRPPFPMGLIARLLEPLFLVHFVEPADLQHGLGREAVIRRYAGGWGMSAMLAQSISGPN
jgi:ubiquinone/menaquinone biosynthesis C-methylase UbiE